MFRGGEPERSENAAGRARRRTAAASGTPSVLAPRRAALLVHAGGDYSGSGLPHNAVSLETKKGRTGLVLPHSRLPCGARQVSPPCYLAATAATNFGSVNESCVSSPAFTLTFSVTTSFLPSRTISAFTVYW